MAVSGTISGHAYFDNNGNSTQDFGEGSLGSNFSVGLYSADGSILYATTPTDVSGNFNFGLRANGTYSIRFGSSGGFRGDVGITTTDGNNWVTGVTVADGAPAFVNQGFYAGAGGTIAGTVYGFVNQNPVWEAGVIVQAYDQVGNLVGSTTTAANGSYLFSGLAGTYTVQIVKPLGQAFATTSSPSLSVTASVSAASTFKDFALTPASTGTAPTGGGSIGGHTFFDGNANSKQDPGDANLFPGFPVSLYNADGSVLYATTAVDGSGNYSFGNLADGTYSVRFATGNGFRGDQGTQTADGASWINAVTVSQGAATKLDQGFNSGLSGSIAGTVYSDVDGNGRLGSQDKGLAGAIVTIADASGHLVETATTDANGNWTLGGLSNGQYTVKIDAGLSNVLVSQASTFTRTISNNVSYAFENALVTSADKVATSLSGTVYADANGNHALDGGEVGVAGANVAVIDGDGFVVATVTTDQNGHYVLPHPEAGSGYRVVVSPPTGYAAEVPQGATNLTLTAGQALDHVDLGLTAVVPATTDAPPPVTKVLNVVLRGQSNAYFATLEGQIEGMRQQIQTLLGFDGVNQRVNLVATNSGVVNYLIPGANTEWPGTSLTANWLHPDGSSWASTNLEQGYLSAINQIPAGDRGAPTAIVMLHNESDSATANLTTATWMSALTYEAGLARAVLGLDASAAPYLFVSPIQFFGTGDQPLQNQAIAVGQAALSADPAFNAKVVTLQSGDITLDHDQTGVTGIHLNTQDQQALYGRAALGVAQEFASSAMPGSPISLANGNIDNLGPQVTKVATVAGNANQLLLTVAFDQATSLQSQINAVAAAGAGWSLRTSSDDATADAVGTAAQIVGTNQILLTFNNPVVNLITPEKLFYGWGGLRLNPTPNTPGNGTAIYDDQGLPLSVDPNGLAIGYVSAGGPTISGTVAGQATAQAAITPFATTMIADPNAGATDTLRIVVTGAGGTLSGTGLVATNDGAYMLSGSATSLTAALHALTFNPSTTQTGTTAFALQVVSNAYPTATNDQTTTVVTRPATAGIMAALAHDTGASPTDGVTSSAVVSGVTDAGATVTLTDEANNVVGSATAGANGQYTIAPTGLADGAHTLTATEVYLGVATGTARVALTLDTTTPAAPTIALTHDTGISATDGITSDASITVVPAAAGGTLRYVVDGSAVSAYDPTTLKDGAHTVAVTQTNLAGNVSAAGSLAFTLDHTAPSLGADAASGTGVAAALTGHLLANDTDASALHVVSVQYANGLSQAVPAVGGTHVNAPSGTLTVAADGSYSFQATSPGHVEFTETVADAAGNTSQTTLTLDVAKAAIPASLSFNFALTDATFDFSHGHDLMTAPDGTVTDLTGVATIAFTDGTVQEKDGASLVDDLYYDVHNLDVWRAQVDPDAHYAANGWHEGRDPNAYFSTSGYLAANPDVRAAGIDPLTHYDQHGWHEGRSPGPNFSAEAYLALNPDVAKAGIDPLAHYLEHGQAEGRAVLPGLTVAQGSGDHLYGAFDATYYLAHNPDVAAAARAQGGSADSFAFTHYLSSGAHEGRDPDALFSANSYLAANPDVAVSGANPLLHYEQTGWFQGRDPSASFHTDAYLAANPDVAAAGIDPLYHYLQFGQAEARHLA